MKRTHIRWTTLATLGLFLCTTMMAGCDRYSFFGRNMTINLNIPTGLGGSPGFYNPFGIVQTVVDNLLGGSTTAGETDGTGGTDGGSDGANLVPVL